MRNLFKFGFLALTIAISLTACLDQGKPKAGDKDPIDSATIDSPKVDSTKIDSAKTAADSTKNAEKK